MGCSHAKEWDVGQKVQGNRKSLLEGPRWKNAATEDRFSKPESQRAQCGVAVFTHTLVGELFLTVKSSVEAINVKHKRRATLVEATAAFAKEGKYFSPGLLNVNTHTSHPGILLKG